MDPNFGAWSGRQGLSEQARSLELQLNAIMRRLQGVRPTEPQGPFQDLKDKLLGIAQGRSTKIKMLRSEIDKIAGADLYKRLTDHRAGVRAIAADCLALEQSIT